MKLRNHLRASDRKYQLEVELLSLSAPHVEDLVSPWRGGGGGAHLPHVPPHLTPAGVILQIVNNNRKEKEKH